LTPEAAKIHATQGPQTLIQPEASDEEQVQRRKGEAHDMEFMASVPLELKIELGHTTMKLKEILELTQGSVIEISKLAGEPMDVYVNNRCIGTAEVVVSNEHFAVRLMDIIDPQNQGSERNSN